MERSSKKQLPNPESPGSASSLGSFTAATDILNLYPGFIETSQDLLCVHDFEGKLLSVNAAPGRILGYSIEELLAMTLPQLLAPEFRGLFPEYIAKIRKNGMATGRMMLLTRSGERRIWEYHNKLHAEHAASPVILGMAKDVTERVHAEQALRANETKFSSAFENAPLGMVLATLDGRFVEANQSFCDFLGYSRAELLGKTILDVTYPDDFESSALLIDRFHKGEQKIQRYEKRYQHKSGQPTWGEVSVTIVPGNNPGSCYFLGQILDINQRKKAEEHQKSNLQQATLLWTVSHLISSGVSFDQVAQAAATGITGHLGCDVALIFQSQGEDLELHALSLHEPRPQLVVPDPHCLGQCLCGLAARDSQPLYCIDIFNDSRCTWDECKKAGLRSFAALPLKDDNESIGVLGIASGVPRDFQKEASFLETLAAEISSGLANSLLRQRLTKRATQLEQEVAERKRVQGALQDREDRLRMMVQQTPGIFWAVDRHLRFTSSTGKGLADLGLIENQVCGTTLSEFIQNNRQESVILSSHNRALRGETLSYEFHWKARTYEVLVGPLRDAESAIIGALGVAIDITDLRQKTQRLQILLEVSRCAASHLEPRALFSDVSNCLRRVLDHDFAGLFVCDAVTGIMRPVGLDFPSPSHNIDQLTDTAEWQLDSSEMGSEIRVLRPSDLPHDNFSSFLLNASILSLCCAPLQMADTQHGALILGSKRENAFSQSDLDLLEQVAPLVAMSLANARAYQEIKQLKEKLAEEKIYLEKEVQSESRFDEIVGRSKTLRAVLDLVETVAPSNATVLITGETGTGKELIARALHRMSARSEHSFIKMNCAAIPVDLLESELFGFERGAFTSASTRKLGRLELADQGTLFLDEVGDLPLELQPKLLRVLEDHEFERLGGNKTVRVNIRLIAATNHDLVKDVAEGLFRSDLFFRLNVFPIKMPPLRERRNDIPALVTHFVQKYAARMKKRIDSVPKETMNILSGWSWGGNIRELENFIERSVILTAGSVLDVPLTELAFPRDLGPGTLQTNVEAIQRDQIIRALHQTGGVIAGPTGAAARLGIKRTTLQSMAQRFGIPLEQFRTNRDS